MGGDKTPPSTFKEEHMKEKLFTVKNSDPKFIINPELTKYLHTTGDIRIREKYHGLYSGIDYELTSIGRDYELTYVNETQCCFVKKNKIEQLIIDVSNVTEQEYDKKQHWFTMINIDYDIIEIPIFIQTVPEKEYKTPQWFDVNSFIRLNLWNNKELEGDTKGVVESFRETDEYTLFVVKYISKIVPGENGGSYGRFENCCVSLDKKTGEVKVELGYDPRSHVEHTIHTYEINEVFVEQYELPQF